MSKRAFAEGAAVAALLAVCWVAREEEEARKGDTSGTRGDTPVTSDTSDTPGRARGAVAEALVGPRHVAVLRRAYQDFAARYEAAGGDRARVLTLQWSRALSAAKTDAWAQVRLDLHGGRVEAGAAGLAAPADLWLVDTVPGRSVRPGPAHRRIRVGTLTPGANGVATLDVALGETALDGFEPDLAVVARAGEDPGAGALLVGHTTLLHKAWRSAHPEPGAVVASLDPLRALSAGMGIPSAHASHDVVLDEATIRAGSRVFGTEQFRGNGRTCATCHDPINNYTLDPAFVAALPADDPLFVAEYDRDLAANFEWPDLMRSHALILANVDGTDDLANHFTMRGVPHTLALNTTVDAFLFDTATNDFTTLVEAVGWSGDGAPDTATAPRHGALRDFALGAVAQHFPHTLARVEDVDYRLPTEDELDGLEAYQLSLGRQEDLDLDTLVFRDATVAAGETVFQGGTAKCAICHTDAGGNDLQGGAGIGGVAGIGNVNQNTGVEDLPDVARGIPRDGGWGLDCAPPPPNGGSGLPADCPGGFGDGTFQNLALVEAADTPPFFHDNSVDTLEEAIAFYETAEFTDSPTGRTVGAIVLTDTETVQIAAFLRAINALENTRMADEAALDARSVANAAAARAILAGALEEVSDARRVLGESRIHNDAQSDLSTADRALREARRATSTSTRQAAIDRARTSLAAARAKIVVE